MSIQFLIDTLTGYSNKRFCPITEGLGLASSRVPYDFEALIYKPVVCLILQGAKETVVGGVTQRVGAGQLIIVSHALPVTARVVAAETERPYLSLIAPLELGILRSVYTEMDHSEAPEAEANGFSVGDADAHLIDVFVRFAALADDPVDARLLGPSIRRELHYRLLRCPSAGMLRAQFYQGGQARNIERAIQALHNGFREPMEMEILAHSVSMSPSAFYKHFKAITSTTPLQYQKELRLLEAQRLLRSGASVSGTAYEVGYQSPSQFSRDYGRKFGSPPSAARPGNSA
ncbi:MAG: AraC family transcriptional regulator N-terminal domain-containing protein [Myxococcota bacterium]